jgi:hypothetical protein
MKFYTITSYSVKRSLIVLFAVFLTGVFQAQSLISSPYSGLGVGTLQDIQAPRNTAMGGLSVGLTGVSDISSKNPASYMNLDSILNVNFQVSMFLVNSTLREKTDGKTQRAKTNTASLGQVSLAFPITNWLKSSFGLTPNSNMSYEVTREYIKDTFNIGKEKLRNYGHGGLNQVFVGFATGTNRISVGVNVNYQIGSFARNIDLSFLDDTLVQLPRTTERHRYLEASGFFFDFGIQYTQPISNQYQFGLGLSYTPKYTLNAMRNSIDATTTRDLYNSPVDITRLGISEKGTLQMPDKYAFGLSLSKQNRWVFGAEYSVVNFKNYREFKHQDTNLSNAQTFRAGLELMGRRMDNNFFNRLSYRLGYHYGTDYVAFQNSQLKQYGVSFGFGIPTRAPQGRFAMLDFTIEIGQKGNMNNGQIQENYGRFTIGISAFDRWFTRGRFD